ncbi:Integrase_core domain-containing protein [Hexamita inflata]|uniref:Integrase_core domain-containing protein n=1 Tax=Hexamita inflata TaxID=28002 RepID=A0ABP1GYN6_9EUKA
MLRQLLLEAHLLLNKNKKQLQLLLILKQIHLMAAQLYRHLQTSEGSPYSEFECTDFKMRNAYRLLEITHENDEDEPAEKPKGRYFALQPLALVTTDLHQLIPPWEHDGVIYNWLIIFLDDHSRYIIHFEFLERKEASNKQLQQRVYSWFFDSYYTLLRLLHQLMENCSN